MKYIFQYLITTLIILTVFASKNFAQENNDPTIINAPGKFIFNTANSFGDLNSQKIYLDGNLTSSFYAEYNENGRLVFSTLDTNGNGKINQKVIIIFDDNNNKITDSLWIGQDINGGLISFSQFSSQDLDGNILKEERDDDGDGVSDLIYTYTYDAKGNKTREERDVNGDGKLDRIYTYTYDSNGNQTRTEVDTDGDGAADEISTYTYDSNGNQIRMESDYDGDGVNDYFLLKTYDLNGNLLKEEEDRDGVGPGDFILYISYTYDANGNQTNRKLDLDRDGQIDEIVNSSYDINGNLTRVEVERDSALSYAATYTYDANSNITRDERDENGDGVLDKIYTYTYDANSNITRDERDENGDGAPDYIATYTYDSNSNKTRDEIDENGDGAPDYIYAYTYDEKGNLFRLEIFDSAGKTIALRIDYFDANGNRIKAEVDNDGDGIFEHEYRFGYYNTLFCKDLGDGLVHKLEVIIPESGVWRFALCGSSFQNVLALSSSDYCDSTLFYATDGCSNGDASVDIRLEEAGTYYLTVGGKGETDKGNYNLEISRLQGLEVSLIAEQLLSIYPNPAQNQITVSSSIKIDSYQIFNTVGEEVLRGHLTNPTIQIESLLTGSYFILLRDGNSNQTYHKKFIK
tara:strand:+ start:586 stop:2481 length:1896 start_codon:yes stop_codon:yes gene_type:complete